ncbi:MAG TPA: ribosome maturation factor RimM [Candidatus Limnocylindria bacterium]|jgi:16S rRNA processing protein RimM
MSSWRSSPTSDRLAAARILGPKGLSGAMRLEVLTDRDDRLIVGAELYVEGETSPRRIDQIERGGRVPVVRLEGISGREAVAALVGRYLEVEAEPLPEGHFYWHELVGLRVRDDAGRELGTLVEIFRAGENEVYRVEADGRPDVLLPALRDVVREIDLANGTMTVHYEPEEVA